MIAKTGIEGLDDVLSGGLARGRVYLVEGVPGRQAISIVKKRGGVHERTIREFAMRDGAITVGEPLRQFRGVLTGVPVFEDAADPLLAPERPR